MLHHPHPGPLSRGGGGPEDDDEVEEDTRKVVSEFCHLLEKSKQLFNGLRDLPPYGHKQWQGYFGRTFDIFTKLWKYQQQHRAVLDTRYGLKRWQIGEIASKIGQLYYHYYLRTSETSYLNEAFSFYAAIRGRAYYSRAAREDRPDLMVKKLRYYARFIVVALLLKKMKLVRDLSRELGKVIDEYTVAYDPAEDQLEWALVLAEVRGFIEADAVVNVLDSDSNSIVLSHRLNPLITPPVEKSPAMSLSLQEVILVGSSAEQAKFSELTLDMFRMLQTLEREPQEDLAQLFDASPAAGHPTGRANFENGIIGGNSVVLKRENPHKYMLYKPTVSQFLVFMASGHRELPANGALLLYISGDGCFSTKPNSEDPGYDYGGVLLSMKKDLSDQLAGSKRSPHVQEINCLHPGDLHAFTRRPLFLVVDSDNSSAFASIPRNFDQPLVVLMSPQETPVNFQDDAHKGSLYTLFLHSPLSAFCFVTNIVDIPIHLWDKCLAYIDRFLTEASRLITRCRGIDTSYLHFMGDDFLRLLLCRHVFACVVLRVHRSFRPRRPRSHPSARPLLPELDLLENPTLQRYALDLAAQLDVRQHFTECGEID